MTLDDRIEQVLRKKGWSEREWAKRAGLALGTVQAIRQRFRKAGPDDSPSASAETLKKLAKAAGVDTAWLIDGGAPPASPPVATAAPPSAGGDLYPNRGIALRVLGDKLHPGARSVLETMTPAGPDLSVEAWLEQAKTWHRRAIELELELTSIEADVSRRLPSEASPAPGPAERLGKRPPPRA